MAARIVGPYLVVTAAALFMRRAMLSELFSAFMRDEGLVFAAGAFTLMAGLTLLAFHHRCRSPSACLISLIAVAATAKGASLMIVPAIGNEMVDLVARTPAALLGAVAVEGLVGAWLTFLGWRSNTVTAPI